MTPFEEMYELVPADLEMHWDGGVITVFRDEEKLFEIRARNGETFEEFFRRARREMDQHLSNIKEED